MDHHGNAFDRHNVISLVGIATVSRTSQENTMSTACKRTIISIGSREVASVAERLDGAGINSCSFEHATAPRLMLSPSDRLLPLINVQIYERRVLFKDAHLQ